jgi:hypothetical protein
MKLESRVFQGQTTERLESLNQKIDAVDTKLTQKIDAVDAKLTNQISSLDKKVDSVEIRMNAQDTRVWTLSVEVVVAMFGLLIKMAFFQDLKANSQTVSQIFLVILPHSQKYSYQALKYHLDRQIFCDPEFRQIH